MAKVTIMAMSAATAVLLSGCGGGSVSKEEAAKQPSINVKPGQYSIDSEGAFLGVKSSPTDRKGDYCVTTSSAPAFPTTLTRNWMLHDQCYSVKSTRTGNAFSGEWRCPLDPSRAIGYIAQTYEGVVTAEGVDINTVINYDQAMVAAQSPEEKKQFEEMKKLMKNITIRVHATRTGDCANQGL